MCKISLTLFMPLVFMGCEHKVNYHLLYPVQASKQNIIRLEGFRFLSSELKSPASMFILSNPVADDGFVDFALALTNKSGKLMTLSPKNILVRLSKHGKLQVLNATEYALSKAYVKPKNISSLAPKMKEYGCVPEDGHSKKEKVV